MTEWHEKFKKEIDYCTYCPKLCRFACPVAQAEANETLTPTAKMTVLKLVRDGLLPFDREAGELVYACSGCLASRTFCEHEIEVFPPFQAAREEAVRLGVAPAAVMEFKKRWEKKKNPFGQDLKGTLREHVSEDLFLGNGAEVVLFPGCTGTHYFPELAADCVKVLSALGANFKVYADERFCCGYPMLALGHEQAFMDQARHVHARLQGAELVLSPCPTCAHTLKTLFAEAGMPLPGEIKPLVQFVAENLASLPLKSREKRKAIYHDPCHLGRYQGLYEEPRQALAPALEKPLLEFYENREEAGCCGGGGGLPVARPNTARKIAQEKVKEALESGAELLVTACPMCRRMLGRAGKHENLPAEDVVSIIARALG